ncbi:MAG TPA: M15 family metallopeptidase [Acidimicrobiales bacterium]|nr:M15 family metallopeptidase [Acidimicrobiales bacterium]
MTTPTHRRVLPLRRLVAVAVVFSLAPVFVAPAAMAKAKKQSTVESTRANAKQIKAELQAVTKRLEAQEAKSVSARQAVTAAALRLRAARAEESAVTARLGRVLASARDFAIREYMNASPRAAQVALGLDPATRVRAEYLQQLALGSTTDLADALSAARQDKERARKTAEAAAQTATNRKRAVNDAVTALRASRDRQLQLAAAAEARYEAALKESQVRARLGARGSRGFSRRGAVSLTTVRGITVATEIAGQLERMLSAADADGKRFGGSGYRSPDGQVAARRRNCGSSDYDVYDKPASRCSPPTARPGQSMHEQGLAIDFTYNGSLIQSRGSEGFQWLKANAARFGFYNLPSEAWHWSTNGN